MRVCPQFLAHVLASVCLSLSAQEQAASSAHRHLLQQRGLHSQIATQVTHMLAFCICAHRSKLPPLPTDTYFNSVDYIEEATSNRLMPAGALTYKDLDFKCNKVCDVLPSATKA